VLRHAEARTRRPEEGRALKDANLPVFPRGDRRRLRHHRAGSVLRADVQAGAAADVPGDADGGARANAFFDPFEYLMLRHKAGLVKTDFAKSLGKVAYHVACHQRVQNFGMKTRDFLSA
jgi:hypothetical protein